MKIFLAIAMIVGSFFVPLALLYQFVWKEWMVDVLCLWRLKVARKLRRAEYIRWWQKAK